MKRKTVNIIGRQQLDNEVNELLFKGWRITSIHTADAFKVKLVKESEYDHRNNYSKIPILNILNLDMLRKIAGKLEIKGYTKDSQNILISRIETYKPAHVIDIYNELTNISKRLKK